MGMLSVPEQGGFGRAVTTQLGHSDRAFAFLAAYVCSPRDFCLDWPIMSSGFGQLTLKLDPRQVIATNLGRTGG